MSSRLNWNISRMECKVAFNLLSTNSIQIGIYPEWNVKGFMTNKLDNLINIGIYPEWNVKDIHNRDQGNI